MNRWVRSLWKKHQAIPMLEEVVPPEEVSPSRGIQVHVVPSRTGGCQDSEKVTEKYSALEYYCGGMRQMAQQ